METYRLNQLQDLIAKLGLPADAAVSWDLLDVALTHPTASPHINYERLEFFGDAVLRLAAADYLMTANQQSLVGELTSIRAALVSDRTLAEIATIYRIDRYLKMSAAAARDQAGQQSRMADAMEAIIGALYKSTEDFSLIRPWLEAHFAQRSAEVRADPAFHNYKAALQEWTQAHYKALPEYRVTEIGATHGNPQRFSAEVWFQGNYLGEGKGRSIKQAEQVAAKVAYERLSQPKNATKPPSDQP